MRLFFLIEEIWPLRLLNKVSRWFISQYFLKYLNCHSIICSKQLQNRLHSLDMFWMILFTGLRLFHPMRLWTFCRTMCPLRLFHRVCLFFLENFLSCAIISYCLFPNKGSQEHYEVLRNCPELKQKFRNNEFWESQYLFAALNCRHCDFIVIDALNST